MFCKTRKPDILKTGKIGHHKRIEVFKHWYIFNRKKNILVRCTGVVSPWLRKVTDLSALEQVRMGMQFQTGGDSPFPGEHGGTDVYPVSLKGKDFVYELHQFPEYHEARHIAKTLARFFDVPLVDAISGVEMERKPRYLDETFLERMKRARVRAKIPPSRHTMKTLTVHKVGNALSFEIPGVLPTMYFISRDSIRRESQVTEWSQEIPTGSLLEFHFARRLPGILIRSEKSTMDIITPTIPANELRHIYVLSKYVIITGRLM